MISITFTNRGNRLSLRLEGHAGYAEHGKDIVCASVSILAYTLASFVNEVENSTVDLTSADTTIECATTDETVVNAYLYAKRGYELLAFNYPQYVRLNTLT
ncbi:MAG: ribosomal-processing cysteine protease Prp [Clostridia bacterium]|nr:ribosomal-processing cysteine protease Prp [Clostridia bacterium]